MPPSKSSSWSEVARVCEQFGPLSTLVRSIAGSPHASGLFPAFADATLWIGRAPDYARGDGELQVRFNPVAQEFTFTYAPRSADQRGWSRSCAADEGIATFERILHKRLRWLHEG